MPVAIPSESPRSDRHDSGDFLATANRLGVSESALCGFTNERSPNPTLDVLAAIVNEYRVDPTWLLYGE
jgi:transcriptional regulator with XRE-family HTH domain